MNPPIWNRQAFEKLQEAEREYLRANGWDELGPDDWDSPHTDRTYSFGHAVNSQKHTDRLMASADRNGHGK